MKSKLTLFTLNGDLNLIVDILWVYIIVNQKRSSYYFHQNLHHPSNYCLFSVDVNRHICCPIIVFGFWMWSQFFLYKFLLNIQWNALWIVNAVSYWLFNYLKLLVNCDLVFQACCWPSWRNVVRFLRSALLRFLSAREPLQLDTRTSSFASRCSLPPWLCDMHLPTRSTWTKDWIPLVSFTPLFFCLWTNAKYFVEVFSVSFE